MGLCGPGDRKADNQCLLCIRMVSVPHTKACRAYRSEKCICAYVHSTCTSDCLGCAVLLALLFV